MTKYANAQIPAISKKEATYYDCEFIGGTNKGKIPYKTKYNKTTIPCKYYPGFIEKGRYLCSDDPNTNSSVNCTKL